MKKRRAALYTYRLYNYDIYENGYIEQKLRSVYSGYCNPAERRVHMVETRTTRAPFVHKSVREMALLLPMLNRFDSCIANKRDLKKN